VSSAGPPPHLLKPEYRELWHAACRLLQQNSNPQPLSTVATVNQDSKVCPDRPNVLGDSAKYSDNSDDECENGLMAQERDIREVHVGGRILIPSCSLLSLSAEGAPHTGERQWRFSLSPLPVRPSAFSYLREESC
jgi:hypothetical protein